MTAKLLLHTCCGPCASHAVGSLMHTYEVTLFFANSNIWPPEEYEKRLSEAQKLAEHYSRPLIVAPYDHEAWLEAIRGLEKEPERGTRCRACFTFNLAQTADYAHEHSFDLFTTTLTISPHKDSTVIFDIGEKLGDFLPVDLKKHGGFQHSMRLSKELDLYRQNYCGCEFSNRRTTEEKQQPQRPQQNPKHQ